ncbi:type II toxin-antitoxin system RelE/ParE family toxin [Natranaerofaba carboxydovora]|uniref:type II toxin-antitoxin system RelE/ParE family toxin n=1 Tax=Natranaerofaba carboxydovora TaxID=2742683 RepID=UPI001F1292AC|nr:type II toxin-antitoxin system RelE/ParE family toxin [Natranaerofaba carboxydovora]UMZ72837.1 hypothetical protein ACONDI_00374 [Natranaerofaba carboxydovora]
MGYEIIYYKDNKLESPVGEFIEELISQAETNKESKQLLRKIRHSYKLLERFGTRIGLPHVRHIEDEIWELRPKGQRILFFTWKDNKIVLLSHFKKKKDKISRREIDKAKRRMNDWVKYGEKRQRNFE